METLCGNESKWHTDPENPMLGKDGKLHDAADKPDQFVYSPSVLLPNHISNSEGYDPDDDLPASFRMAQRPKWIIKHITWENPIEAFKQQKLAAKGKNWLGEAWSRDLAINASLQTLPKNRAQVNKPSNPKRHVKMAGIINVPTSSQESSASDRVSWE
ncbi:uncharacterized protein EI90DRAFT_3120378 [Cantharellus anzutake]|uniref:uncharacterized protein n=1 Tax=Cantharellus anzutake TaxID=1750568 RepID=UPI001907BD87|nr:uncharacterized protein EI90DRAFT_3120378 [Cantharellus anzutake]KAF8335345.1 hypothetical protein EI90DRAFT_3120378 [Cantharellus anzutake]